MLALSIFLRISLNKKKSKYLQLENKKIINAQQLLHFDFFFCFDLFGQNNSQFFLFYHDLN